MEIKAFVQKIFRWPVVLGLILIGIAAYFSAGNIEPTEEPDIDVNHVISDPIYFSRDGMPCMFTQIIEGRKVYGGITCDWTRWRYKDNIPPSVPTPTYIPPFLP